MAIDFTMSTAQKKIQTQAREFALGVLAPAARAADREPDRLRSQAPIRDAYIRAYHAGFAMAMLPTEYGGRNLSCLDFTIASEEINAVEPSFGQTLLRNGLGLMPIHWYGSGEQRERLLRAATSDPVGDYVAAWTSGRESRGAGAGVTATLDGDCYVLNGRRKLANAAGWDGHGVNLQTVSVLVTPAAGGRPESSVIAVERGTPGVSCRVLNKRTHQAVPDGLVLFNDARVPAENMLVGPAVGELVAKRNVAWSGPLDAIAAVGVARAAYEAALTFAKRNTARIPRPLMQFQSIGYVLGDVAAKIESARYFAWRAADYLDKHHQRAELLGEMCRINVTEAMFDCVYQCLQVMGSDELGRTRNFNKFLHAAALLPTRDGGDVIMQRQRVHGVLAHRSFNPRAAMNDEIVYFDQAGKNDEIDDSRHAMPHGGNIPRFIV